MKQAATTIFLLLLLALPACARNTTCDGALDLIRPLEIGETFGEGWTLYSAQCMRDGAFSFTFKKAGFPDLRIDAMPYKPGRPAFIKGKRFDVSFMMNDKSAETPPEVENIIRSLAPRFEASTPLKSERKEPSKEKPGARMRMRPDTLVVILILIASLAALPAIAFASRRSKHGCLINICLSIAALLLALSSVEIAFRTFDIRPADRGMARFVEKAKRSLFKREEHVDNYDRESGVVITENSLGFRDAEHPLTKPPGVFRIAFIGDSFMRGEGDGYEDTFPIQFRRAILKKYPDMKIETMNYGLSGCDAKNAAALLLYEAPASRPDLVVWGFVLNDVGGMREDTGAPAIYDGIIPKYGPLEAMLERHSLFGLRKYWRFYDYAAAKYENTALTRATLRYYLRSYEPKYNSSGLEGMKKDFSRVARFYRDRNVPVVMFIYPLFVELDRKYPFEIIHRTVEWTARETRLEILDTLPVYLGRDPSALWASPGNHHPNALAQELAADTVSDFVIKKQLVPGGPASEKWPGRFQLAPDKKDAAVLRAKSLLSEKRPSEALDAVAPALEWFQEDLEAQYVAALAMTRLHVWFASSPIMHRLINAGPPWTGYAEDLKDKIKKDGFFRQIER